MPPWRQADHNGRDERITYLSCDVLREAVHTPVGLPPTMEGGDCYALPEVKLNKSTTATDVPQLITLYPDQASEVCMADFTRYQVVVLLRNIPEERLCAGDVGTIVERHDVPGRETGYSVEFLDMLGNTVAVVMLPASARWAPPELIAQHGVRNRRR